MKILRFLFTPSNALHLALQDNTQRKALELIKADFHLNNYYAGSTPLEFSLIYGRHHCTVRLLEKEVNTNAYSKNEKGNNIKKIIQSSVSGKYTSEVKILALYGANTENVIFKDSTQFLAKLIKEKNQVYFLRKQLESQIICIKDPAQLADLYQKLSGLWANETVGEKNDIYISHYQKKSYEYHATASSMMASLTSTHEVSLSEPMREQELEDEHIPLLPLPSLKKTQ